MNGVGMMGVKKGRRVQEGGIDWGVRGGGGRGENVGRGDCD